MKINILENFNAQIQNLAADKSISHRFAIFSLLTNSTNRAKNYLLAEDTLNTLEIIKNLGAKVALVEMPMARNYTEVNNMKLTDKYINATLEMLKNE